MKVAFINSQIGEAEYVCKIQRGEGGKYNNLCQLTATGVLSHASDQVNLTDGRKARDSVKAL